MSAPPPPPRKPRPEPSTPAGPGSVAPPPRRAATTAPSTAQSAAPAARSGRPAPGRPAPGRPPAESRQNARPASPGRGRTALLSGLAILGVIVIAGAAFLVLRSDSTEKAGPTLHASTSIDLQPGELTVDAVGTPVEFPTDVRDLALPEGRP